MVLEQSINGDANLLVHDKDEVEVCHKEDDSNLYLMEEERLFQNDNNNQGTTKTSSDVKDSFQPPQSSSTTSSSSKNFLSSSLQKLKPFSKQDSGVGSHGSDGSCGKKTKSSKKFLPSGGKNSFAKQDSGVDGDVSHDTRNKTRNTPQIKTKQMEMEEDQRRREEILKMEKSLKKASSRANEDGTPGTLPTTSSDFISSKASLTQRHILDENSRIKARLVKMNEDEHVHRSESTGGSSSCAEDETAKTSVMDASMKSMKRRTDVLDENNEDFFIPTSADEAWHAETAYGKDNWRAKLLHFMEREPVVYTFMGLLVLDVLILFVELFLSSEYPLCRVVVRDAISCCPAQSDALDYTDDHHDDHRQLRLLAGSSTTKEYGDDYHNDDYHHDDHHSVCPSSLVAYEKYSAGCDAHKYEVLHNAEFVLFLMSMTILGLFLVELFIMVISLGPKTFFRQKFYVFDLFVVASSFALELSFKLLGDEKLASVGGILIIGRLWRFVRIGHGIVEATAEIANKKHEKHMEYCKHIEAKLEYYEKQQQQQ